MGPSNGIMGNDSYPDEIAIPRTTVPELDLSEYERKVKYSKSAEFKMLKERLQARIEFLQVYLPGGQAVADVAPEVTGAMWIGADLVIREYRSIINEYESAAETIKHELAERKAAQGI